MSHVLNKEGRIASNDAGFLLGQMPQAGVRDHDAMMTERERLNRMN
ncbi:hypothetical protein [Pigmentiphaga aceris]|nr:hypothetical protein [Pigmentiphaga aceris]